MTPEKPKVYTIAHVDDVRKIPDSEIREFATDAFLGLLQLGVQRVRFRPDKTSKITIYAETSK